MKLHFFLSNFRALCNYYLLKKYIYFFRYKRYQDNLDKTKKTNREDEKEFVAEVNDISPGTEWDRVTKLCDFGGKNANKNSSKDMTRMKSILLQLKQQQTTKNAS